MNCPVCGEASEAQQLQGQHVYMHVYLRHAHLSCMQALHVIRHDKQAAIAFLKQLVTWLENNDPRVKWEA